MSLILAIDLGKYNSVFCGLDTSSGEVEFRTAKFCRSERGFGSSDSFVVKSQESRNSQSLVPTYKTTA